MNINEDNSLDVVSIQNSETVLPRNSLLSTFPLLFPLLKDRTEIASQSPKPPYSGHELAARGESNFQSQKNNGNGTNPS